MSLLYSNQSCGSGNFSCSGANISNSFSSRFISSIAAVTTESRSSCKTSKNSRTNVVIAIVVVVVHVVVIFIVVAVEVSSSSSCCCCYCSGNRSK